MKLTAIISLAVSLTAFANAAPLAAPTPVFASPDASADTLAVLPAGTTPVTASAENVPAGWSAITLPGPHTVFVDDQDLLKNFDVKPGASYRTAPNKTAAVLSTATAEDEVQITGLSGRWLQLSLKRGVTGFIKTTASPAMAITRPPAPAPAPAAQVAPTPAPAPAATTSTAPAQVGHAVEPGSSALPRIFQGTLASSRSAFRPRRPYDYQLNDSRGVRYAYLDLGKLLLTEQIDSYVGRTIEIFGTATNMEGTKDIVIKAETLKLP